MKRKMSLIHPGEILKMEIEGRGLTLSSAASLLDVTRSNLSNVLNGKSAISPLMALRVEANFGGTARLWTQLQATYDLEVARKKFEELQVA